MNFEESCKEAKKIAFSFKNPLIVHHYDSVTGDNYILAEFKGKIRKYSIQDLFNRMKKEFGSINRKDGKETIKTKNLRVFSFDGKKTKLTKVKTLISHFTDKDIIHLKTSAYGVKLTNDHSIISIKNDELCAMKPSETDFVCSPVRLEFGKENPEIELIKNNLLPQRKTIFFSENKGYFSLKNKKRKVLVPTKIKIDKKMMAFFGLWIADGCYMYKKGREGIRISSYKDKETKKIVDYVFSFFGASTVPTDKGITAVVCNKTMFNFMRYLDFVDGSRKKNIPSWVFGVNEELMSSFLRGYFSGDGTVSKGDINATTHSDNLKNDLISLLLFFGIRAKVRKETKKGRQVGWKISINHKNYKKIFIDKIGFLQEYKNQKISLGPTSFSNLRDLVPISHFSLLDISKHVTRKIKSDILRLLNKKSFPTRFLLSKVLKENIPLKIRNIILNLLSKQIYFEPICEKKVCNKSKIRVYDLETDSGNFVCENLVLKNTDGISSGSIVISAFRKEFKNHRHKWIRKLDSVTFESLEKEKEIIFVDLGSGNERVNELKDVLIIDHHQPKNIEKPSVNPLNFGIDGGTELSASGTAYCVFETKIDLAVVGAIGDMQYPFEGKNREILEKGIKEKEIILLNDLRLYGRSSRPLTQFLAFSDEIYLPGITYNESNALGFLEDLEIELKKEEKWKTYVDLNDEEKEKLKKSLMNLLLSNDLERNAKELIGEVYLLNKRPLRSDLYDASEFSTILNACGRHGKAEIGVGVCLGDNDAYIHSLELLKYHKTKIREGILYARNNIQDLGYFLFLDAIGVIDEGIIGIVCGMVFNQFEKKPIFGVSLGEKETLKISSRGNRKLVEQGLNLGKIISQASEKVGGSGGGHKIAAGASIPRDKLDEFLLEIGTLIRQ